MIYLEVYGIYLMLGVMIEYIKSVRTINKYNKEHKKAYLKRYENKRKNNYLG